MIRARKRFGQHFLEPAWRVKVIDACGLRADDQVVEIGPGLGALTEPAAARVRRLLGVEIDRDLAAALTARALPNVGVVAGDFLQVDWTQLMAAWPGFDPQAGVRVIGNLPYNVSSPILFRLLDLAASGAGLIDATLMLQAEVAERLTARVGTGEYGVLTVLVALGATVTPVLALPPGAFRPVPKVRSAVVRLTFRPPPFPVRRPALVTRLVRTAFMQRRKTIANGLKALATQAGGDAAAILRDAGLDPRRRPETLQLVEFVALADAWPEPVRVPPVL